MYVYNNYKTVFQRGTFSFSELAIKNMKSFPFRLFQTEMALVFLHSKALLWPYEGIKPHNDQDRTLIMKSEIP